ncbi:hypothetical protein Ancab_027490 [Ancistrocladus abbreviatus]
MTACSVTYYSNKGVGPRMPDGTCRAFYDGGSVETEADAKATTGAVFHLSLFIRLMHSTTAEPARRCA